MRFLPQTALSDPKDTTHHLFSLSLLNKQEYKMPLDNSEAIWDKVFTNPAASFFVPKTARKILTSRSVCHPLTVCYLSGPILVRIPAYSYHEEVS